MPIPLFTTGEKPSPTETQTPSSDRADVTSTPLTSGGGSSTTSHRRRSSTSHETVRAQTREEREEADRLYEERIEDEYAKREGGA